MKNRGHKVKFRGGRDANRMLIRKLASNFFLHAKLETTKQKAKAVQPVIEKIVTKAKNATEANKKYISKNITTKEVYQVITKTISPQLINIKSGYTRIIVLGQRQTDGAQTARLEWAHPVVIKQEKLDTKPKTKSDIKIEEPKK